MEQQDSRAEKRRETRQRNREAQERAYAEKRAALEKDKPMILEALRAVITDTSATVAQRLYAVSILDSMQGYNLIPYSAGDILKSGTDAVDVVGELNLKDLL